MRARIGRYRIERKIGSGGMGDVYLALDEELNRKVAIKTLRGTSPEARERLRREARAQALSHPNIVAIHDVIDDDADEPCLVMQYIDGPTLEQVLAGADDSRLAPERAVEISRQILCALEYMHSHGVVHRDLKPTNVMIAGDTVKLTDFGIALLDGMPRLTTTSKVIGTWLYAAPEQFDPAANLGRHCDIYSTGLVLYRMLAGQPAYPQKDQLGAMQARLYPPSDLRTAVPGLSAPICEAVSMALQREPARRFQTAVAFSEALADAVSGLIPIASQNDVTTVPQAVPAPAVEVTPVPPIPSPPHKPWALVSFLSIGVALLIVFALWRAVMPSPPKSVPELPTVDDKPKEPVQTVAKSAFGTSEPPIEKPVDKLPRRPEPPPGKRPVDLSPFRRRIAEVLKGIEPLIASARFDSAQAALNDATELAQRHGLKEEQKKIDDTRQRVLAAEIAAVTKKKEEEIAAEVAAANWERRLREIEALLPKKAVEARNAAETLRSEAGVPAAIALRALELRDRAYEAITQRFATSTIGPTSNEVQKRPNH